MNVTDVSNEEKKRWYIPCFCPCHKRYKPYLEKMNGYSILSDNNVTPCTHTKPFTQPEDLKAHLHDKEQWTHFLLYTFVQQLHEVQPATYSKDKIQPTLSSMLPRYTSRDDLDSETHEVMG